MKRRNFFKTLGLAVAGAAIIKPDFSQSEEIQPVQVRDDPLEYNEMVDTKCKLYYKGVPLTSVQSVKMPSLTREIIDITTLADSGDYSSFPGLLRSDGYTKLLGCVYSNKLREIFENGDLCNLIVDENETRFTSDVIIMGINIDIDLENPSYCSLEVEPISDISIP